MSEARSKFGETARMGSDGSMAGEWDLVALAYNGKRLHKLKLAMAS